MQKKMMSKHTGPYLVPNAATFYTTHVSLLVCTRHKADFPLQQTRATTLTLHYALERQYKLTQLQHKLTHVGYTQHKHAMPC